LDRTLEALSANHLDASGALGDFRPLRALRTAVEQFHPDQIVIVTLPASDSVWQRFEVVDRAGELGVPVTHVEATSLVAPV
jgi:GABA permease